MEPFAQNKAEGTKKVIVASKNTSNNVLRARPAKGAASPRNHKNRPAKTFPCSPPANGSLINLSWQNTAPQISPGIASAEKTPLGHYRSGTSFETSCNGVQLNSSNFLSESKFSTTLFSSAAGHSSHGLDVEEAMDIDHQDTDINSEAACAISTSNSASKVTERISPPHDLLGASKHKNATDDSPTDGKSNKIDSSTKPMESKEESSMPVANQKKETVTSAPQQKATSTSLPQKRRAIYIVLHVSTIKIGQLVGKASAPVKIYAEKMFIEMETNEGNGCKRASYHFRIPCKDLTECKISFSGSPFLLVVKPSFAGASIIQEKCQERGKFLDPQSSDASKRYIVLVMNYHVVPRDVKADLTELFQNRFADQLTWSELSSQQAQDILDKKDEAPSLVEGSSTQSQSPKPASPINTEQRKILTPKGKGNRKKLFAEGSKPAPTNLSSASSSGTTERDLECAEGKNKEISNALDSAIQTRSRRRKASAFTESDKPAPTGSEPVKPDILLHHKKMESHISLLDQHSKEQRENLQQHQKLLEFERGKLREVEEEKERNLGRMRDLEISYSADKERLLERIRILETALHEKDEILTQKTVNGDLISNELKQEKIAVRQLQKELEQEREANSHVRKVQSDLVRVNRALDEEKVLRNMREQQLRDKETNFHGLQGTLAEEQQARLRLEEELRQTSDTCTELERRLENERLLRETNRQDVQTKEDTIREQSRLLQQERELKTGLEERIRNLQIHVEEERNTRIATERELTEERITLQQDRENLERERETYEQRIRDSERTVSESEHRLRELQSAVTAAQEALAEYRRLEPRDWIIRREEVILSEKSLGVGAWGKVYEGTFRGCQVAVKQIHDLILSPHNRRLFEREMSIASRCRHPHLLQFIGATNDDGSPLFITELLDTDLRNVLTQRALHHEEVVCIALDVAKGLNYLHLNKPFPIIHRDISSSNVLLWRRDDCWRAKLSDYGAANFMRQYMTSNPGARIYAAPESQTSQQSPKVDVYSFGLLLCEICIRELPVPQQIQDQIGLVTNGVLRELIMRCVARAPEARPTMNDVIFVLTQQAESLRAEGLVTLNGRTATL